MIEKRKKAQEYILKHITVMDPSGQNTKRYEDIFKKMSDKDFDAFMKDIRNGKQKLFLYTPNMENNLDLDHLLKAADMLNINLLEQLKLWDSSTKKYYTTSNKYLVVTLPTRRLKQYLEDKISVPDSDSKIDAYSGQVVKPDKGASISGVEMQTMISKGLHNSIAELTNVRGGNIAAYADFKAELEETGEGSLQSAAENSRPRSAVVAGAYLTAMMIENNL